eukprot:6700716-Prymnesium_polylepis.1
MHATRPATATATCGGTLMRETTGRARAALPPRASSGAMVEPTPPRKLDRRPGRALRVGRRAGSHRASSIVLDVFRRPPPPRTRLHRGRSRSSPSLAIGAAGAARSS